MLKEKENKNELGTRTRTASFVSSFISFNYSFIAYNSTKRRGREGGRGVVGKVELLDDIETNILQANSLGNKNPATAKSRLVALCFFFCLKIIAVSQPKKNISSMNKNPFPYQLSSGLSLRRYVRFLSVYLFLIGCGFCRPDAGIRTNGTVLTYTVLTLKLHGRVSQKNTNSKKKSQIPFCKILENNWYHAKVLLERFHLNGHTKGFR